MSTNQITLSQACEGMIRYKQATGKSDHTIADYRVTFKKLSLCFPNDPPIASITRAQMGDSLPGSNRNTPPTRMGMRRVG